MKSLRWLRCKVLSDTRWGRQTCGDCYRDGAEAIWFYVPDAVWGEVMGDSQAVVCLACFDRRAHRRGVNYAATVEVQGRGSWLAGKAEPC